MENENKKIDLFGLLLSFVAIGLVVILASVCMTGLQQAAEQDTHNYLKYRAEFEGRQSYISYIENNHSFPDDFDFNNIASKDGRHPNLDLYWQYSQNDKYLTLLNQADILEYGKEKSYDLYTSLCRSIQDTKSDYFQRNFDSSVEPKKRTLEDIDENLDCIFEDNQFKIIYLLDKQFVKTYK